MEVVENILTTFSKILIRSSCEYLDLEKCFNDTHLHYSSRKHWPEGEQKNLETEKGFMHLIVIVTCFWTMALKRKKQPLLKI